MALDKKILKTKYSTKVRSLRKKIELDMQKWCIRNIMSFNKTNILSTFKQTQNTVDRLSEFI